MRQLVEYTLKQIGKYSQDSANLILGTIAQESSFGKYRRQLGNGPALGICQIEPFTFDDCVNNYLRFRPELYRLILSVCGIDEYNSAYLEFNDKLSICIARVKYMRNSEQIPSTVEGYAYYWKRWYNSEQGKGKTEEFIENYNRYILAIT